SRGDVGAYRCQDPARGDERWLVDVDPKRLGQATGHARPCGRTAYVSQDRLGRFGEFEPGGRRCDAPARPDEQPDPETPLDALQRLAQSRLGHVELRRRLGDVAAQRDLPDVLEVPQCQIQHVEMLDRRAGWCWPDSAEEGHDRDPPPRRRTVARRTHPRDEGITPPAPAVAATVGGLSVDLRTG